MMCKPFNFVLFQDSLGYSRSFAFLTLKSACQCLQKKSAGIVIGVALDLDVSWVRIGILTYNVEYSSL